MSLLTTKGDIQKATKAEYFVRKKKRKKSTKRNKTFTSEQVSDSISLNKEFQRLLDRD